MCTVIANSMTAFASQVELSSGLQKNVDLVSDYEGFIIGNNVSLKSGPGTNDPSYVQVNYGDTFIALRVMDGENPPWVKFKMTSGPHKGTVGYVLYKYAPF